MDKNGFKQPFREVEDGFQGIIAQVGSHAAATHCQNIHQFTLQMDQYILGLSCYYHDSAAALLKNGEIVAAAQEERFSRKKNDSRFPKNAILYCLKSQGINLSEIKEVVYYEKPLLTFERLLETYLVTPRGGRSFIAAMQVYKRKLF